MNPESSALMSFRYSDGKSPRIVTTATASVQLKSKLGAKRASSDADRAEQEGSSPIRGVSSAGSEGKYEPKLQ